MQAPPPVDLGAKDRVSPSLGARLQKHFLVNRTAYALAAGAAAAAAAGAAGHRSGLERGKRAGFGVGWREGYHRGGMEHGMSQFRNGVQQAMLGMRGIPKP